MYNGTRKVERKGGDEEEEDEGGRGGGQRRQGEGGSGWRERPAHVSIWGSSLLHVLFLFSTFEGRWR